MSPRFPIFEPQVVHAFEFPGVVGDESQIECEGLAADLQIVGTDFGAGFLKLETDFRCCHGGVPIEGQEVELLQKGCDFVPLTRWVTAPEDTREQLEYADHRHGAIIWAAGGKSLYDAGISAHGGDADVGIKEVDHAEKSTVGGSLP